MLKKLFIIPYCGDLPSWYDRYVESIKTLSKYGFDWLITTDIEDFKNRMKKKLGINPTIMPNTIKMGEFHPLMGLLYQEELKGYDFWGHTDFDVVYGRIDKFISDKFLEDCDVYGNDFNALCGPFSLYRNIEKVNLLFKRHVGWEKIMTSKECTNFDEDGITKVVRMANKEGLIRFKSGHFLDNDKTKFELSRKGDSLFNFGKEIMMFHFKETKVYPNIKIL